MIHKYSEPLPERFVLKFYADWCSPCHAYAPVYKEASEYTDVPFLEVDVDAHPEVAQAFNVRSIPHIIYVDGNSVTLLERLSAQEFVKQIG